VSLLRTYQQAVIDDVRTAFRTSKRVCLQVPTGGGKTVIASYVMQNAVAKGNRVLFLVHLKELIEQTSAKLSTFGVEHGIIAAGFKPSEAMVQIAMVQTLSRRGTAFEPNLIVIDEFHHAVSKQYKRVLEQFPQAKVLGLTATPIRLDGKGLKDVADVIVTGPTVKSLIEQKYLNSYRYFSVPRVLDTSKIKTKMGDYDQEELQKAIDESGIVGDAIGHYRQYLDGKKAIVFCQRIKHSQELVDLFLAEGIQAAHLDGTMPKAERESVIEGFRSGAIKVLSNCSLISEGFDVPDCDGVIMLRPTQSLGLYLQMIGRGLRPSANPTIVLDHVGNYTRHGLPCDAREWSLEGKTKTEKQISVKTCKQCFAVFTGAKCSECGLEPVVKVEKKPIKAVKGQLVEIMLGGLSLYIQRTQQGTVPRDELMRLMSKCSTLEHFNALGRQLNYSPGWGYNAYVQRKKHTKNISKRF